MAVQKQDGLHTDVGVSAADLTRKEGFFCSRNTAGAVVLANATSVIAGVISEGRPVGKHTSFNTAGNPILRVVAGAALAVDQAVGSDAQGRAVPDASNPFGRARVAVTAAGITAEIIPGPIAGGA